MSNGKYEYKTIDGKRVFIGGDEIREYSESAEGNTKVVLMDDREYTLSGSRYMIDGFLADRSKDNDDMRPFVVFILIVFVIILVFSLKPI